jgi:hypothetical protein
MTNKNVKKHKVEQKSESYMFQGSVNKIEKKLCLIMEERKRFKFISQCRQSFGKCLICMMNGFRMPKH